MKKILFILFAIASMNMMAQSKVVVAGDNVCLHTSANELSKITGANAPHFNTGDVLTCLGQTGNYYEVSYHGDTYYLPKKYGRPRGTATSTASHPDKIVIAGDQVCLRTEPNESSKMTDTAYPHLYTGNVLKCTGIVNGYYQVIYGGEEYYVPKKYGRPRN